jgi:OOP family OmpA-OmpF porin
MTPAMTARACAIVVLGAAAPHGALAAGFYMDASISRSGVKGVSQSELDAAMIEVGEESFDSFVLDDSSIDRSNTGYSFAVGYQFTPHVAIEAAFVQLGKVGYVADVTVDQGGGPVELTAGFDFKSSGPALSVAGTWPVGASLALDARAGAYFARTKVSVFASDGATTQTDSLGSEEDTSLLLGVGATWTLTGNLALRLGYTRFEKAVAGEGDAGNLSLGIRVLF